MRVSQPRGPAVPSPIARLLDEEGQLQPHNSIVMSTRLANHRNGLAESYFKSKQKTNAKTNDSSELVQLRKKTADMSRDFQGLLSAHERQEATVADLRRKVRTLRQELEQRDKALDLARRTVDRLNADKGQLEAGSAGTQAYVRKLEARLLSVKHAAELQQRCAQLKAQLGDMAHELHEAQGRAAAAEAAAQQSQLGAACLKRGLELAAEQLTKSAGAEVPGTLLRAVARGQEEALALSMQLSDAKQQVAQLTAALAQAKEHLQAQQLAATQSQGEQQQLRQRAEAAEAALEQQRATTAELRRVLNALKPKAGALAEEREGLRRELELQRTAAADAQKEAKQLRAALRQKATVEAALRDELRQALAGEGLTPPATAAAKQAASSPAATRLSPWRSGGRQRGQEQQQQQQRGRQAPAQPSKRVGGPLSPRSQSAHKVYVRQASAWEQREPAHSGQGLAKDASKGRLGADCGSELLGAGSGGDGSGDGGLIAAEPSPTRALLRLQEQRRQQQGSRLGGQQQEQPEQQQERPAGRSGWREAVTGWQVDLAEPSVGVAAGEGAGAGSPQALHRSGGRLLFEDCSDPLSPPDSGAGEAEAPHPQQQQQEQPGELSQLRLQAASVLPVQDGQLMKLYSSALDEQIAALETDLAQLGVAGAPSPITQLQQQARAGNGAAAAAKHASGQAPPALHDQRTAGSAPKPPNAEQRSGPAAVQQQQEQQRREDVAAAWRPNTTFDAAPQPAVLAAALPAPQGMRQLISPGGDTPGMAPVKRAEVPPLWHTNPLAGSPPKRAGQAPAAAESQQLPERVAEDALTVRARGSQAGEEAAPLSGALPPGAIGGDDSSGAEDEWPPWNEAQQAAGSWPPAMQPAEGLEQQCVALLPDSAAGSVASSPSLRLPASPPAARHLQRGGEAQQAAAAPVGAGIPLDKQFELQPHRSLAAAPAASEASRGGRDSAEEEYSLSRHWELPSPGAGNSDWLSNEFEADIEHLEVNSGTPLRLPPQQRQAQEAREAAAAAFAAGAGGAAEPPAASQERQEVRRHARAPEAQPRQAGDGDDWMAHRGTSRDSVQGESAPLLAHPSQLTERQPRPQRAPPMLPGMALVSDSPLPAAQAVGPVLPTQQRKKAPQQQQPQQQQPQQQRQQHTLFDLADMDLSELLSG